jgi:hypothetical protein
LQPWLHTGEIAVRRILLAAFAVAVLPASVMFCRPASATMIVAAPLRDPAPPVHTIRNVCGMNGCAPVFTKRIQVPPRNFTTTAAPLVVSGSRAVPPPPPPPTAPWPLSLLQRK